MKRIYKISVLFVLGIVLTFFTIQNSKSISYYEYITSLDESPERVFQFLTSKKKIKLWKPDLRADFPMDRENLSYGIKGVSLNSHKKGTLYHFKVTALKTNRLLTLQVSADKSERMIRYQLVRKYGRTYLRYSEISEQKSFIGRLMRPFLKIRHYNEIQRNLLRLKKIVESELV